MIFEIALMQTVGTSASLTLIESIMNLATFIALLVGAIVPIIISGLVYVKVKSFEPKIAQALDIGIAVGRLTTLTANKTLENKEMIKSLANIYKVEGIESVKAQHALIDTLTKQIKVTSAQIHRLKPMIPGIADADTIATLPREEDILSPEE